MVIGVGTSLGKLSASLISSDLQLGDLKVTITGGGKYFPLLSNSLLLLFIYYFSWFYKMLLNVLNKRLKAMIQAQANKAISETFGIRANAQLQSIPLKYSLPSTI